MIFFKSECLGQGRFPPPINNLNAFEQVPNLWKRKKKSWCLHVVSRDLFDTIVLSHISSGSEVGKGTDWRPELL